MVQLEFYGILLLAPVTMKRHDHNVPSSELLMQIVFPLGIVIFIQTEKLLMAIGHTRPPSLIGRLHINTTPWWPAWALSPVYYFRIYTSSTFTIMGGGWNSHNVDFFLYYKIEWTWSQALSEFESRLDVRSRTNELHPSLKALLVHVIFG